MFSSEIIMSCHLIQRKLKSDATQDICIRCYYEVGGYISIFSECMPRQYSHWSVKIQLTKYLSFDKLNIYLDSVGCVE